MVSEQHAHTRARVYIWHLLERANSCYMLTVRASLTLFHRDFAKGDLITSSRAKETLENQTRNRSEWKIGAKSVDGSRLVKSG